MDIAKELLKGNRLALSKAITAIENGQASYGLNEHEILSIRCHMWPLAFHMPASRMAVALTLTDKVTAVYEVLYGMKRVSRTVRRFAERVMPEFR